MDVRLNASVFSFFPLNALLILVS